MASGIAMVVMATPAVRRSTMFLRVLNTLLGLGFFGYGFYLALFFDGGSYLIFFKAFILPAVLIFRTIQSARLSRRQAAAHAAAAPAVPAPQVEIPRY